MQRTEVEQQAHALAARTARLSYGRLLALVAARSGDIAASEDALADAFKQALEQWPMRGVPSNPEAWLLTVARRRQIDHIRSADSRMRIDVDIDLLGLIADDDAEGSSSTDAMFPDERLKLLFVCAHPAINAAVRTPLMLQTVLGLEADEIARAFLVPTATMAQRLVRAKRKIGAARIPFVIPEPEELASRIEAVLEAVFGLFSIGWEAAPQVAISSGKELDEESLYLAGLLVQLLPGEPEVRGLAALIGYAHSRRAARVSSDGRYVPIDEQDVSLWDHTLIGWAEQQLQDARRAGSVGRFQLEASIQSVHAHRARSGTTDWQALALLYTGLMQLAPSVGAAVGRAIAISHVHGAQAGLDCLALVDATVLAAFQPALAARAHLLSRMGRVSDALAAYDDAIELTVDPVLSAHLLALREALRLDQPLG